MSIEAANATSIEIGGDARGNIILSGSGNTVIVYTQYGPAAPTPTATALSPSPYRGLDVFREQDADHFFGREDFIEQLRLQLQELWQAAGARLRLLPLIGPSGCGKSSLARAGLVAELARRPLPQMTALRVAVLAPGAHPVESLAAVLARVATSDPMPAELAAAFTARLRKRDPDSRFRGLCEIAAQLPGIEERRLVVLCDQFEEVYSLCDDKDEQDAFIRNLLAAASDRSARVSVVLTLRSDFLGATQRHSDLNQILAKQGVLVPAMSAPELRRAISEPARRAGRPLDDATVELLLSEAEGNESSLPLLQFALAQVWLGLEQGIAAPETLKKLGGVGGALAGEAQRLYDSLDEAGKRIARRSFLGMVRLGEGTRDTRRRVEVKALVAHGEQEELVKDVLRLFAQRGARLVALSAELGGLEQAEVTHEALLEHWGQLREWLAASREDIRFHRRLEEATGHWEGQGRAEGLLWRAPDLDLLQRFVARAAGDLTAAEMSFFRASRDFERARQELREKEAAAERRATRFFRMSAVGLALLVGAATSLGVWTARERDRARARLRQRYQDEGRIALLKGEDQRAALYLAEAYRSGDRGATTRVLLARALRSFERPLATLRGHKSGVYRAAFSPDGKMLATASWDSTVRLWEPTTGQLLRVLQGHTDKISSLSFHPNGDKLLTGSSDGTAKIWSLSTGRVLHTLSGHDGTIVHAVYSPDGRLAATAGRGDAGEVILWNTDAGILLHRLPHMANVEMVAFSFDGTQVISASHDKTAKLWDVQRGRLLHRLTHPAGVSWAEFDPDGETVVTACEDGIIRLWDAYTGQLRHALRGHEGEVVQALFSLDGSNVLSASNDRTARLWNAKTGEERSALSAHEGDLRRVGFSADGTRVVTAAADHSAKIWDVESKQLLDSLEGHSQELSDAVFSPDGALVVTTSFDRTAKIWPTEGNGFLSLTSERIGQIDAGSAAWSGDSRRLVTAGRNVVIWDPLTGSALTRIVLGKYVNPASVSFSPDGRQVVTGGSDSVARVWDSEGKVIREFRGHSDDVNSAVLSHDGRWLLTGSDDRTARIWEAASGKPLHILGGHDASVTSASFDRESRRVLTFTSAGTSRIWDSHNGRELYQLRGHEGRVNSAVFSPDGRLVLTAGDDRTARLWDAENGRPQQVLRGHTNRVGHAAFDRDGQRVVTASDDGNASIWEVQSGARLISMWHQSDIHTAVFSPDGAFIATGGTDHFVTLWEADTGRLLARLLGHSGVVTEAIFSPDGHQLITGGSDGAAKLWELRPEGRDVETIEAILRCYVPQRLAGGQLVPAELDPASCPPRHSDWLERARPRRATNLYAAGQLAQRLGNLKLARARLEQALELFQALGDQDKQASVHVNLGELALDAKELGKAATHFEAADAIFQADEKYGPGRALIRLRRGMVAREAGQLDQAQASFEQAAADYKTIKWHPQEAESLAQIGILLHEYRNDPAAALVYYDRAISLDNESLILQANRAEALFASGRFAAYIAGLPELLKKLRKPEERAALATLGWAAALLLGQKQKESGQLAYHECGALPLGRKPSWLFNGTRNALRRLSLPNAKLSPIFEAFELLEKPIERSTLVRLGSLFGVGHF